MISGRGPLQGTDDAGSVIARLGIDRRIAPLEPVTARAERGACSPMGRGLCALTTPDLIRGRLGAKGEGLSPIRMSHNPSPFAPKFASLINSQSPLPLGEGAPCSTKMPPLTGSGGTEVTA